MGVQKNDQKEQKAVEKALQKEETGNGKDEIAVNESSEYSIAEYEMEKAYKVYNLPTLLITEYQKKGNFRQLITDDYRWKVPFKTKQGEEGVMFFKENDGEMDYFGEVTGKNMKDEILPEQKELAREIALGIGREKLENILYTYSFLFDNDTPFISLYPAVLKCSYLLEALPFCKPPMPPDLPETGGACLWLIGDMRPAFTK